MPSSGSSKPGIEPESLLSPALVGGFFTPSTTCKKTSSPKPEWLKHPTVQGPTWTWSFRSEGRAVHARHPRLHQLSEGVGSREDWAPAALAAARWAPAGSRTGSPAKANSAWSPRVLQKSKEAVPGLQPPEPAHRNQGQPQPISRRPWAAPPVPHKHSPGIWAGTPSLLLHGRDTLCLFK